MSGRLTSPAATLDAPQAARRGVLAARQDWEVISLTLIFAIYTIVQVAEAQASYASVLICGSAAFAAVLLMAAYRMARASLIAIWSPIFWFRITMAIYFGVGAIIPYIVSDVARQRIYGLYYFDNAEALKACSIQVLGTLLTLTIANILMAARPKTGAPSASIRTRGTAFYALLFLSLGAAIRYGLWLPYAFGLLGETIVPGSVLTLGSMFYVGIFLAILSTRRGSAGAPLLLWSLILFDAFISVTTFAKVELLTLQIFVALGYITNKPTMTRMGLAGAVMLCGYFAFQPLVGFGRDAISQRYGGITGAPLEERLDIISRYLANGARAGDATEQSGLTRLSYLNVSAYAVAQYDSGRPGSSFANAAAVFVPRVLWPDKPIISALGEDLYVRLSGRRGSSVGMGSFSEAYWNFGWPGVAGVSIAIAVIFAWATRFSMNVMARRDWLYLPVVLLCLRMGLRSDGAFTVDILGAAWIAFVIALLIWALRRFVLGEIRA